MLRPKYDLDHRVFERRDGSEVDTVRHEGRSRRRGRWRRQDRGLARSTSGSDCQEDDQNAGILAHMTLVTITPKSNGPLIIEGPVRILAPDGRELTPPLRKDGKPAEVVVLCRCGASATKPFCDGTHKRIGFQDVPVTTG